MRLTPHVLKSSALIFLLLAPALPHQRRKPCEPYATGIRAVSLPKRFTKLYEFVIDNKLEKMIRLHRDGSRVTGRAFYIQGGHTTGTATIEGTIDRRGNLCLLECSAGSSDCYHHRATYVSPTEIHGTLEVRDDSGSYTLTETTRRVPPPR